MAYWDYKQKKIIHSKPKPIKGYPGWEEVDCGCCGGIQWGGEFPEECDNCNGSGYYCKHIKSGALAKYPGGPFV
jgi:hypothetical protein